MISRTLTQLNSWGLTGLPRGEAGTRQHMILATTIHLLSSAKAGNKKGAGITPNFTDFCEAPICSKEARPRSPWSGSGPSCLQHRSRNTSNSPDAALACNCMRLNASACQCIASAKIEVYEGLRQTAASRSRPPAPPKQGLPATQATDHRLP